MYSVKLDITSGMLTLKIKGQMTADYLGLDKKEVFSRYSHQVSRLKPKERGKEKSGIREFEVSKIVLDANHPLAGKDLIFDVQLVEIL